MNIAQTIKLKVFGQRSETDQSLTGFGTFEGVFLPSILSIFGVIMYLRLGYLLGNVGIFQMSIIILLASSITFITGLSIAATATNMHVKGGGVYYMLSRSLGVEIGSAIGVSLYLAQVIGIAFYVEGFSESLVALFPIFNPIVIEGLALVGITALAYTSASIALKTQLYIFLIIVASLISIFFGGDGLATNSLVDQPDFEHTIANFLTNPLSFWAAFAIFFPAVTGIEAGFSMSGDLKNPKKSLPLGTLAAVSIGTIVYLLLAFFMWSTVPEALLVGDSMVMLHVSRIGFLVILGIWGATLSSAIGGILGAPRTLQALAKDGILPKFLGKGFGPTNEPRVATCISFALAFTFCFFGNINAIAPILTMFFLISYGMLNFATGLEELLGNPSWRPTFYTPWVISFVGSGLCLFAMFMMDPGATFTSMFVVSLLYLWVKRRNMSGSWDDIRQGVLLFFSRFAIYRLANLGQSARSWRPYFLVFSSSPTKRPYTVDFASSITKGKGFMTVATMIKSELSDYSQARRFEDSIQEYFRKTQTQSLVEVPIGNDFFQEVKKLMTSYGLGPITPNTVVLGEMKTEKQWDELVETVLLSMKLHKNVILLRGKELNEGVNFDAERTVPKGNSIDIWWDEDNRQNSELMLVLAHMLQSSPLWRQFEIYIKCLVPNEQAREHRINYFQEFLKTSRLDLKVKVLVSSDDTPYLQNVIRFSSDAAFTFMGQEVPKSDQTSEEISKGYQEFSKKTKGLQNVAFVLANEEIDLTKIFH